MKRYVLAQVVCLTAFVAAADPKVGDSRDRVDDELGPPTGRMAVGNRETCLYERGTIEFVDGRVAAVKLVTEQQLRASLAAAAEQERLAAEKRKQLTAEGGVEKAKILADPSFTNKPPAERLARWREFAATYPGVDVSAETGAAQQAVQSEVAKKREEERAAAIARQKQAEAQKPPPLSSSKLRKYYRSHDPERKAGQP